MRTKCSCVVNLYYKYVVVSKSNESVFQLKQGCGGLKRTAATNRLWLGLPVPVVYLEQKVSLFISVM